MTETSVLKFRGRPRRLEAVTTMPQESLGQPLSLELDADYRLDSEPTVAVVPFSEGMVRVLLGFSRSTTPGEYKGIMRAGDAVIPFLAEVQPIPYLKISPRSLRLEASAGSVIPVEVTIANDGNVACEIRPAHGVGLFPVGGIENALSAAYRSKNIDGSRWIDRVGDNLNKEYGGLIRVKVLEGGTSLSPGETRNFTLLFHLPAKLEPNRVYSGTLPLHNLVYYVEVRTPGVVERDGEPVLKTPK